MREENNLACDARASRPEPIAHPHAGLSPPGDTENSTATLKFKLPLQFADEKTKIFICLTELWFKDSLAASTLQRWIQYTILNWLFIYSSSINPQSHLYQNGNSLWKSLDLQSVIDNMHFKCGNELAFGLWGDFRLYPISLGKKFKWWTNSLYCSTFEREPVAIFSPLSRRYFLVVYKV